MEKEERIKDALKDKDPNMLRGVVDNFWTIKKAFEVVNACRKCRVLVYKNPERPVSDYCLLCRRKLSDITGEKC